MSTPSQARHAVGLTKDIGRFVAEMRFERVPEQAIPIICTGFTDCVGVMIAGLRQPVTAVVARAFKIALDIEAIFIRRIIRPRQLKTGRVYARLCNYYY